MIAVKVDMNLRRMDILLIGMLDGVCCVVVDLAVCNALNWVRHIGHVIRSFIPLVEIINKHRVGRIVAMHGTGLL